MTFTPVQEPVAFTTNDYLGRARRVAEAASEKALAGVLVTPGPDLVCLASRITQQRKLRGIAFCTPSLGLR
jgi:hypothetical protein